ncbi:MAG: DUF2306 domain-containing protein [Deltaproteobacteria bacterium]|nr:DUF2306 domain-containing protein [Deltaproteobacteria bacterium]
MSNPQERTDALSRERTVAGRLALALLVTASLVFMGVALHRYLSLDPARSLVPLPPGVHPVLVAHVVFGSVAMLAALHQFWPGVRDRSRSMHRRVGRVYVLAGVLPAGICAVVVACYSPFGPVARASNLVFASVWLGATLAGYRAGRRGEFEIHRRWMIRSGVLTFSILTNRLWGPIAYLALEGQRATTFHGDETFFAWTIAGLSTWLGWTLPLLAVEAFLEWESSTDRPGPAA